MSQTYPHPDPHVNLASYALEHFLAAAVAFAIYDGEVRLNLSQDVRALLGAFVGVLKRTPSFPPQTIRYIIGTHFRPELGAYWRAFVQDEQALSGLCPEHFNLLADPSLLAN